MDRYTDTQMGEREREREPEREIDIWIDR